MKNKPSYLIQGTNIILVIDRKSYTIAKDHISYSKIVEALNAGDWATLKDLVDPVVSITKFGNGNITVSGGKIYWKGQHFNNSLADHIIRLLSEGFPVTPLIKFMENLMANPSKRSVDQCYDFVSRNKLPITEDGHFLAFKRVRAGTYKDIYTGTIDNNVGDVVTMDRNSVDDNPESYCSVGLHFCSESYLDHFGKRSDPVMILKINPADVVSIPTDYNGAKGRCCKYTVVAEVTGDPAEAFATSVVSTYDSTSETDASVDEFVCDEGFEEMDDTPVNTPVASWPFPATTTTQYYDVVKRRDGTLVESKLTYAEANVRVQKNIRQKKAALDIVPSRS